MCLSFLCVCFCVFRLDVVVVGVVVVVVVVVVVICCFWRWVFLNCCFNQYFLRVLTGRDSLSCMEARPCEGFISDRIHLNRVHLC